MCRHGARHWAAVVYGTDIAQIPMKLTVYGEPDRGQMHISFKCIIINCDMCYEAREKKNFLSERKNSLG